MEFFGQEGLLTHRARHYNQIFSVSLLNITIEQSLTRHMKKKRLQHERET